MKRIYIFKLGCPINYLDWFNKKIIITYSEPILFNYADHVIRKNHNNQLCWWKRGKVASSLSNWYENLLSETELEKLMLDLLMYTT